LAARAGTLNGGGILFVFPPEESSHFKKRLLASSKDFDRIEIIQPSTDLRTLTEELVTASLPKSKSKSLPSKTQTTIIDGMIDLPGTCHIHMADRRRGKSPILGLACQGWIRNDRGRGSVVTGTRPSATTTLFEQAAKSVQF